MAKKAMPLKEVFSRDVLLYRLRFGYIQEFPFLFGPIHSFANNF